MSYNAHIYCTQAHFSAQQDELHMNMYVSTKTPHSTYLDAYTNKPEKSNGDKTQKHTGTVMLKQFHTCNEILYLFLMFPKLNSS